MRAGCSRSRGTRSPTSHVARVGRSSSLRAELPAEDGWLAFRVHAAVAELPEQERVPLELAYWGGRSQSEIAELLGLPLGTVKTRTRSALARLAVRLEGLR